MVCRRSRLSDFLVSILVLCHVSCTGRIGSRGIFFFPFCDSPPSQLEEVTVARFARLTLVGKSAGHQLACSADLPTKVNYSDNGAYRLVVVVREFLPTHGFAITTILCWSGQICGGIVMVIVIAIITWYVGTSHFAVL